MRQPVDGQFSCLTVVSLYSMETNMKSCIGRQGAQHLVAVAVPNALVVRRAMHHPWAAPPAAAMVRRGVWGG